MTKQEQFLFIVQTAALANSVRIAANPERADKYGPRYSTSGMIEFAASAIAASERIPDQMSAVEAASQFLRHKLDDFGDAVPRTNFEWLQGV